MSSVYLLFNSEQRLHVGNGSKWWYYRCIACQWIWIYEVHKDQMQQNCWVFLFCFVTQNVFKIFLGFKPPIKVPQNYLHLISQVRISVKIPKYWYDLETLGVHIIPIRLQLSCFITSSTVNGVAVRKLQHKSKWPRMKIIHLNKLMICDFDAICLLQDNPWLTLVFYQHQLTTRILYVLLVLSLIEITSQSRNVYSATTVTVRCSLNSIFVVVLRDESSISLSMTAHDENKHLPDSHDHSCSVGVNLNQ